MALHAVVASLDKQAAAVARPGGSTAGPYLEFLADRADPFSEMVQVFFPHETPIQFVMEAAALINKALAAAPQPE